MTLFKNSESVSPVPDLASSILYDEKSFYNYFVNNLLVAKGEFIDYLGSYLLNILLMVSFFKAEFSAIDLSAILPLRVLITTPRAIAAIPRIYVTSLWLPLAISNPKPKPPPADATDPAKLLIVKLSCLKGLISSSVGPCPSSDFIVSNISQKRWLVNYGTLCRRPILF